MAISWRLKTYIGTRHGIFKATEFQKIIVKKTGVLISLQNICNYLKKPKSIPLKTIEIICTALNCKLSDFCTITPAKMNSSKVSKLFYEKTPYKKRGTNNFPDPENYEN